MAGDSPPQAAAGMDHAEPAGLPLADPGGAGLSADGLARIRPAMQPTSTTAARPA